MKVGTVGYNYKHDDNFIIESPNGCGAYLLLLIKEPSIFIIDGQKKEVAKNSCILFDPFIPHSYYGKDGIYTDDWIFIDMDKSEERNFADLSIPINEVTYLGDVSELSELVKRIAFEHYSSEENHSAIESHYFNILLLKLSNVIKNREYKSKMAGDKHGLLLQIRTHLYGQPQRTPSIDEMARSMGLSRSGFVHLYKKVFGVSVMQDRIKGRMDYAGHLLRTTNMSIREIALLCGYSDEFGLIKRFKSYYGKTPTEYRGGSI